VLRLYVMNSANVLFLSQQLPQPGAPIHVIADSRIYPNVAAHALPFNFYVRDILQNIFTARLFPPLHIVIIGDSAACVVKVQPVIAQAQSYHRSHNGCAESSGRSICNNGVQAAVAALLTLESFWRHTISYLICFSNDVRASTLPQCTLRTIVSKVDFKQQLLTFLFLSPSSPDLLTFAQFP